MNTRKGLKLLLVLVIASSCASVKIGDNEFCGDMGELGASCFNTLSEGSRDIPKEEWDEYRVGMICSKADTFANWKKALMKLCNASRRCKFESKKKINNFGKSVESFKVRVNEEDECSFEGSQQNSSQR